MRSNRSRLAVALCVVVGSVTVLANGQPATALDPQPYVEAARAIAQAAQWAFLITVDRDGQPQSRLMQPFAPDPDFEIWLGTTAGSRKVEQLRHNPRATLSYLDPKGPDYLTLIGAARVVDAVNAKRAHWREGWEKFFPGGPDGPEYVVIAFTPARIELVSNTHGIAHEPASPAPAIVERRGDGWVVVRTGSRPRP